MNFIVWNDLYILYSCNINFISFYFIIKQLTEDGLGWVDDFAVKGPAPDSAKLSWDKSPVANGAHYFLFGRVDPNDPPGILREKGFGVEFPNYIVGMCIYKYNFFLFFIFIVIFFI